ncbi:MAG: FAD-dependent oxidoreductase [Bacillota bacterium]|nr:FAD-dependent oxidoreductase [Bacillota bacterium]
MKSLWQDQIKCDSHDSLNGDIKSDCVVIGGGMAGLLTAFRLQNEGISTVVLEAGTLLNNASGLTTAKITSQHGLIYDRIIRNISFEKAQMYYHSQQKAIDEFESIIQKNQIDCDFKRLPACVFALNYNEKIKNEAFAIDELGISAKYMHKTELPFPVESALCFENQAMFHPAKFMKAISEKLTIYENSPAVHIEKNKVFTKFGSITTKHTVVATHYPFINVPGYYFLRMHQDKSYVIAIKTEKPINAMYIGCDGENISLRQSNEYLLVGGSSHRVGSNKGGCYEKLYDFIRTNYPNSSFHTRWSNQDCMTHDGIPLIGQYANSMPYVYVATGFNKWGMSSSMVSAMLITDKIIERKNDYEALYTPQRFNLRASVGGLIIDMGHSVGGLTAGLFASKNKKCRHLGCKLHNNLDVNTLECRCHGSQFTQKGNAINGPTQKGLFEK